METLIYVLAINFILGIIIIPAIDKDREILSWAKEMPVGAIGKRLGLGPFIVLNFWFIVLFFYLRK